MHSAAASGALCIRRSRRNLNDRVRSVEAQGLAVRRRVGPRPAIRRPRTPVAHVSAEGLPGLPPAQLFLRPHPLLRRLPRVPPVRPSLAPPRPWPVAAGPQGPAPESGLDQRKGLRVNAGRSKRVPEEPGENPAPAVERWVRGSNTGFGRPNAGNEHRRGFSEGRCAAIACVGVSPALRGNVRATPVPSGLRAN
jgi:hypothetical protein